MLEPSVPEVVSQSRRIDGRVSVGDRAEVRFFPGILRFLMTRPAADAHPPGVGIHPMSGIPLGMGVEAAILAVGGKENGIDVLRACEGDFLHPIGGDDTVLAVAEVESLGARHVRVRMEVRRDPDGPVLFRGVAVLVHSVDGRAQEIRDRHGETRGGTDGG